MKAEYKKGQIKSFEIRILASGEVENFLNISFTEFDDMIYVHYEEEGYKKLTEVKLDNPFKMLDIIEKVLIGIKKSSNYFIPWYRYEIRAECIYFNPKTNMVKIAFVPYDDCEKIKSKGLNSWIMNFFESVAVEHFRCNEYIENIKNKIKLENPNLKAQINYIGELKREAYLCGWG